MHFLDRILRAPLRPVAIGMRIEVRLKDRFQHQLGGGLHHPVPDGRDAERPLAAAGLRDHHPPHRLWLIRLRNEVLPDAVQPLLQPRRFDRREAHPIHPRRALHWRLPARRHGPECLRDRSCRRAGRSGMPAPPSPCDTAFSEGSGYFLVFPGSSPITDPLLLQKRTRSKGPSLRRRYPASAVP